MYRHVYVVSKERVEERRDASFASLKFKYETTLRLSAPMCRISVRVCVCRGGEVSLGVCRMYVQKRREMKWRWGKGV